MRNFDDITSYLKKDFAGYLVIIGLVVLVVKIKLLILGVFFLFLYLLSDLAINGFHSKFKIVPRKLVVWSYFVILLTLLVLFATVLAPKLIKDLAGYWDSIQEDTIRFLAYISNRFGVEIDIGIIKQMLVTEGSKSFSKVLHFVNVVSKGTVYFVFAVVLTHLVFLEREKIRSTFTKAPHSLMSYLFYFIVGKAQVFYGYFKKVMTGQFFISLINTALTGVLIYFLDIPHKITLLFVVFACGLIPVVGNLISNTILTITALVSVSIFSAVACLIMLVVIHKLEYFLNSKIIGSIIHLPMAVTLIALLVGEAFLGVMGLILALPLAMTIKGELEVARLRREKATGSC